MHLLLSVELLGFEPRQTEPKSVVLPLHHSSIHPDKSGPFFNGSAKIGFDSFSPKWFLKKSLASL